MVTQKIAVISRKDYNCIVSQAGILKLSQNAAHTIVDKGDLTIIIGGHLGQLPVGLRRDAGVLLAQGPFPVVFGLWLIFQRGAVPPWALVQIAFMMFGDIDVIFVMQTAPRFGAIEWVVGVRVGCPQAKGSGSVLVIKKVHGSFCHPSCRMPCRR